MRGDLKVITSKYNISNKITKIDIDYSLDTQPGKCVIELIRIGSDGKLSSGPDISMGENIIIWHKSKKIFDGFVFTVQWTQQSPTIITLYDRLRYLQSSDTKVKKNPSGAELFNEMCTSAQVAYTPASKPDYKLGPKIYDNRTWFDILHEALEDTIVGTSKMWIPRDNPEKGKLELVDIESLRLNLLIGDKSFLGHYDYSVSIDAETYNYIKLVRENETTNKREMYIASDQKYISMWGKLQYYEKVDDKYTEDQLKLKAENLLKLYCKKKQTLTIEALGDDRVVAGTGLYLSVRTLPKEFKDKYAWVQSVTHHYQGQLYTMTLELAIA